MFSALLKTGFTLKLSVEKVKIEVGNTMLTNT
jgi:hypothetical protein